MEHNFHKICRICLLENENLINLSTVDEDFVEFSTKLYFCIPSIQIDDTNFPQHICFVCSSELKLTYSFKQKCLTATQKIKKLLNPESNDKEKDYDFIKVKNEFSLQNTFFINDDPKDGEEEKNTETNERFQEEIMNIVPGINDHGIPTTKCDINNSLTEADDKSYSKIKNKFDERVSIKIENEADEEILPSISNDFVHLEYSIDSNQIKIEANEQSISNSISYSPAQEKTLKKTTVEKTQTEYQYYCTICSLGFENDLFTAHSEIHENLDIISCPMCKREFDTSNMMLFFRHYCSTKTRQFVHYCPVCIRNFKTRQALANHKKIHKEKNYADKVYLCQYCDIYFSTPQKLDWHMRNGIHTDKVTKKLKKF